VQRKDTRICCQLNQCYSDVFQKRKANLDNGSPRNGASSPVAEEGSPASCSSRAQRIKFLKGLSTHEQYKTACKTLKGRFNLDDIEGLPAWASWSFGGSNLPESFYEMGRLELAVADIGTVASSANAMEHTLVLAFGLALRGLAFARATHDPEEPLVKAMGMIDDAEGRILGIIERTV
jgi:hypothetical protein